MNTRLTIATCQFPVSGNVASNTRAILRQLRVAARKGADVAHFSEGALGGYAGSDFDSFETYDWEALRAATDRVIDASRNLSIWVILGSNHRLSGRHKPHNALYIIAPRRGIVDRYDKLFCTGKPGTGDLAHYSPGSRFVTVMIKDVRCGFLICHDWRYPEVYREYERLGVKLIFQSWYDGNLTDDEMHRTGYVNLTAMPATVQGHAACNHLWISASNTSRRHSLMAAMVVQPDGVIAHKAPRNRAHVLLTEIDTSVRYRDPSAPWRRRAARGVLHSGTNVRDPRSDDRTCR